MTPSQRAYALRYAANARERFKKEAEWGAREQAAGTGVGGWMQRQLIDAERFQFEEGLRLDDQIATARLDARSSGGSSRKAALTEEQKAIEDLNKSLTDRLNSLQAERLEMELVASGQFETADGARAMAEAMLASGGAVDGQTAAMIRQIDAAAKLNKELKKVAQDPVKQWVDSVPNWIEAGQKIEVGAINSLRDAVSEFAQTGKFDFEALGASILATAANIIADMAVKELIGLLGGNVGGGGAGFGIGDFLGAVFGAGAEGGYSESLPGRQAAPLAAFQHAPHFASGTANTSGIPSILHPNEAVIPLTKGRKVPVEMQGGGSADGGKVMNFAPIYNIQTPDADSFRRSQKQLMNDTFRAGQRAAAANS